MKIILPIIGLLLLLFYTLFGGKATSDSIFINNEALVISESEDINEAGTAHISYKIGEDIDDTLYIFQYGDGNGSIEQFGTYKAVIVLDQEKYDEYINTYGADSPCPANFLNAHSYSIRLYANDKKIGEELMSLNWEGEEYGIPLKITGKRLSFESGVARNGRPIEVDFSDTQLIMIESFEE